MALSYSPPETLLINGKIRNGGKHLLLFLTNIISLPYFWRYICAREIIKEGSGGSEPQLIHVMLTKLLNHLWFDCRCPSGLYEVPQQTSRRPLSCYIRSIHTKTKCNYICLKAFLTSTPCVKLQENQKLFKKQNPNTDCNGPSEKETLRSKVNERMNF